MENHISKFIRELENLDGKADDSQSVIRQIIDVLDDGVFFLDEKLNFLEHFSESCKKLFSVENLHRRNFIKFLGNKIPERIILQTEEYLSLLCNPEHSEDTISELNPLNEIEFHIPSEDGLWSATKYLTFTFKRFPSGESAVQIIAVVKDVTRIKELANQLDEIEAQSKKKIKWLINLLYVEPSLLKEFITLSDFELKNIDKNLKSPSTEKEYGIILKRVSRGIHHINSNASILNLDFITRETNTLKKEIDNLKGKKINAGQDFIPIVVKLGTVQQLINEIKEFLPQIKGLDSSLRTTRRFDGGLLIRALENLIRNLAEESGKKIIIRYHNFDSMAIPFKFKQLIKEFLIVLTRFVVEFGIEESEKRRSININPTAVIELETIKHENGLGIKFRHNGNLIHVERLLEKKMAEIQNEPGPVGKTVPGSLHPGSEVMRMFFAPEISSSGNVGTTESIQIINDFKIVKNKLRMNGGQLKVTFTSGSSCEYDISLPFRRKK